MSGGAFEWQMGSYIELSNILYSGRCDYYNSGFKGLYGYPSGLNCNPNITNNTTGIDYPTSKFYTLYLSTNWNINYLGEALGETNGWYKDSNGFVIVSSPWFRRGGYCSMGLISGNFGFAAYYGKAGTDISFRTIVTTS